MSALSSLADLFAPHLVAAGLHGLRLLPAALLSPFFGGPLVPPVVRLALAFGVGAAVHAASGANPQAPDLADLVAAAAREVALGTGFGLLAAIPVEAARAAGRLADTLRGATLAELHVAPIRQRETALGDLLAQWAVVLAGWVGADRLVVRAVVGSFAALPAGTGVAPAVLAAAGLRGLAELAAAAFCLGAPAAAGVLLADLALALASRAAPWLGVPGAAQPARAALGLFPVALSAAAIGGRLIELAALSAGLTRGLAGGIPP